MHREEKKAGKKYRPPPPDADGRPAKDRGALRAGSMWRVMEAGRLLQTATKLDPSDEEVAAMAKHSKPLTTLNAHEVRSRRVHVTASHRMTQAWALLRGSAPLPHALACPRQAAHGMPARLLAGVIGVRADSLRRVRLVLRQEARRGAVR